MRAGAVKEHVIDQEATRAQRKTKPHLYSQVGWSSQLWYMPQIPYFLKNPNHKTEEKIKVEGRVGESPFFFFYLLCYGASFRMECFNPRESATQQDL